MVKKLNKKLDKRKNILYYLSAETAIGCLAQLIRASRLHREGRGFESLNTHHEFFRQMADFYCEKRRRNMKAETKNNIKEILQLIGFTAVAVAFVFQFNNTLKKNETDNTTTKTIKNDSIKTDSIKTVQFAKTR